VAAIFRGYFHNELFSVDITTKKYSRKIKLDFVASATNKCRNRNEKAWQIWSYLVVIYEIFGTSDFIIILNINKV